MPEPAMTLRCQRVLLGVVLASLLGGPTCGTPRAEESLVLPPYLESVVLDVLSDDREAAVEVFPPDADQPLSGVEEVRFGKTLRTLILRGPAPGRWVFRRTTRVKVRSQQFSPRGMLVEPAGGEPLRQHDQVYVAYQVTDENGSPFAELPGYPLSAELVLVQPGGRRLSLALERQPRGNGIFRTPHRVECKLPGRYGTEVLLTTRDLAGRRVKVLQDRWSGFRVRR